VTRLPRLTGQELIDALAKAGFEIARTRGSHCFLRHADGRSTVVPVHAGEVLGPGITAKILRDCELSADTLLRLVS
jgi:predicted RNA binding protein YcfA (HicA-like mRNA interferase family)